MCEFVLFLNELMNEYNSVKNERYPGAYFPFFDLRSDAAVSETGSSETAAAGSTIESALARLDRVACSGSPQRKLSSSGPFGY